MKLFKKKWLTIPLSILIFLVLAILLLSGTQKTYNAIEFEYQEGAADTVEFELLLKNMVYSFVKAKLHSDNYFDIDDLSNDSALKEEILIALEEATLAIQSFDMITDLIIEDTLRLEEDVENNDEIINQKSKNFSFVSKAIAMNL